MHKKKKFIFEAIKNFEQIPSVSISDFIPPLKSSSVKVSTLMSFKHDLNTHSIVSLQRVTFLNPDDHFIATSRQLMAWVMVISLVLVLDPVARSDVLSIIPGDKS